MLKKTLSLVFTLLAWAITISIPLLAIWAASSLAAYHLGMAQAAVAVGLFFFPVFPILWDLWGERKRRKRGDERERILRRTDRLLVRTFVINGLFLATMFCLAPAQVFTATSARGDWFLDDAEGPIVEHVRDGLHRGALGLEWLYELAVDNPYGDMLDGEVEDGTDLQPEAQEQRPTGTEQTRPDGVDGSSRVDGTIRPGDPLWPVPAVVHPAVTAMPASARQSMDTVAAYLADNTHGEADLAKAVHDFVALHVDYDAAALTSSRRPPQDAESAFRTGTAVCAGYANLFAVIGTRAGLEALYIVGDSRSATSGEVGDRGHAWNVVKVDGTWYHLDATWNAGSVNDGRFDEQYGTDYLFTPAHLFGETHYPDNPQWQLLERPIDRATFARRLIVAPGFHAAGLRVVQPTTWPADTGAAARVVVDNPNGRRLWVQVGRPNSDDLTACERPSSSARVDVSCALPARGQWTVHVMVEGEDDYFWSEAGLRFVR